MNIYTAKFSQVIEFYVYEYLRSKKSKYGDIGSPYYVGKGRKNRAYVKHNGIHVPKDKSNIRISSLSNEADALQKEILKIEQFGRIDLKTGCLRNMTNGGDGTTGSIKSIGSRQKTSISMKGKNLGKIHPTETKQKISKAMTGGNHPNFGKIASTETKKKQSESHKGKQRTKESINKTVNTKRAKGIPIGGTTESIRKGWETRRLNKKS